MNNIEKLLNEEKEKIDKIEIPNNIEEKLRTALNEIPVRKKKRFHMRAVAIIIIVLLLSYNMDTLAFYGKKFIGYDSVMNGSLERLNEMGKGQLINKSHTFSDGVEVVLDGVMLDDNNIVVFYTINDPDGDVLNKHINTTLDGFLIEDFPLEVQVGQLQIRQL